MIFDTTVHGIPCKCQVLYFHTGRAATWNDPPESAEFEYVILDRRGRPAPWLAKHITERDDLRLFEEAGIEHAHEQEA